MTETLSARMQVIRFLALGGVAAGVNYLSRFAYDPFVSFELAVILAYVTGMVVAFFLFQKFVFGDAGDGMAKQAGRFATVNAVGILVALAVSSLLARIILPAINWTLYPYAVAHAVGILAPTFTSYIGHKFFTYKKAHLSTDAPNTVAAMATVDEDPKDREAEPKD